MGRSKKAEDDPSELAAEAASIESSVRLAERMARESGGTGSWPTKKALLVKRTSVASPGKSVPEADDTDDLAAEAASIESSVRLTEQIARETGINAEDWPVKKTFFVTHPEEEATLSECATPLSDDELLAEAASIESSVRLTERMARETDDDDAWPVKKSLLDSRTWPRLKGRTSRQLRREAKYQMYYVYEHYPDEMKALAVQVITKGCLELDEKGARNFVNKVWANKRLQENLQGAMNATYYRELFEAEEQRLLKRSIPEIYLDGDNAREIFCRMRLMLFRNMDAPNRIYLVRTRKGYNKPLPKQLYEMFEAEKAKAARRARNRQRFYR